MALNAAKTAKVGIITPYKAQSRLLHAMARDAAEECLEIYPISCATVHQFQGSEKDVIIFDAVDCYRMQYPGMLLTSMANNYANRLFNVALTRAKGKFIGVANIDYMNNKNLSCNLMLGKMIEFQKSSPGCVNGQELLPRLIKSPNKIMSFFENDGGNSLFIADIAQAKREVRIDIPNTAQNNSFIEPLANALKEARAKGVKVYLRAENKQLLPDALKPFAIENPFIANPIILIDKKVVWFGMPTSAADFITEGRVLRTKYRPIIRFVGLCTAASLYGFLEMSRTIDQSKTLNVDDDGESITETLASYIKANRKCSYCGKPMVLRKSRSGGFFLGCSSYPACTEKESITPDLVDAYLYRKKDSLALCPRCGRSLEAKRGQYGTYVQCCGIPAHRFKLNEI